MTDDLSSAHPTPCDRVTLFLALLASDPCRAACHQVLAPERFAYVWCRLWFDEIYVPSARYLDGLKGDRSDPAVDKFWAVFTKTEREALERFHRFLELRIDMLPRDLAQCESFPQNDAWDHIVRHAGYALEELEPDPASLKEQVGWVARLLASRGDQMDDPDGTALPSALRKALHRRGLPE